ncbi:MAG: hypothetical protein ACYDHM_05785 [Acidiferrobacterales bacterium]
MAEATQFTFSYKEVAEALIKKQGLNKGFWSLYVEFGIAAGNVGPDADNLQPAAIVPVVKMGLLKVDKPTNLTVDAAIVNPNPGEENNAG